MSIYVCLCVSVFFVCLYVFECVHEYLPVLCVSEHVCLCVCLYVSVFLYVFVFVCINVSIFMCVYLCVSLRVCVSVSV